MSETETSVSGGVSYPTSPYGQVSPHPGEIFEDLRKSDVDEHVAEPISNLLSRDFILGYAEDAEVHELRWLARNVVDMVFCEFPPDRSVVQAEYRRVLLRDQEEGRSALSGLQKLKIEETVLAFLMRITRSRGGYQQDKLADTVQHNIVEQKRDDGRRLGGLFS